MPIVKDMKDLPKDEPKLQKYTIYALLIGLMVSIGFVVWYFFRLSDSDNHNIVWSLIHIMAYIAYVVVTGLGLFGVYYPKPQFLCWYLIGTLSIVIAELICVLWNMIIVSDESKKFSIVTVIFKVLGLLVFITCGILGFLWKRILDKQSVKASETAPKSGDKPSAAAAATIAPKNEPKKV